MAHHPDHAIGGMPPPSPHWRRTATARQPTAELLAAQPASSRADEGSGGGAASASATHQCESPNPVPALAGPARADAEDANGKAASAGARLGRHASDICMIRVLDYKRSTHFFPRSSGGLCGAHAMPTGTREY